MKGSLGLQILVNFKSNHFFSLLKANNYQLSANSPSFLTILFKSTIEVGCYHLRRASFNHMTFNHVH